MAASPIAPARRARRWRRPLIVVGILLLLLAVGVAMLPTLLSTKALQPRVERELSSALGAAVRVRDYSLGWLSGLSLDGLEIAQPAGFVADRPLLQVEHAELHLSLARAITGTIDIRGVVDGARLVVVQKEDGRVNVRELGRGDEEPRAEPGRRSQDLGDDLERLGADLALRNVAIDVVHETKGALESVRQLDAKLEKRLGTTDFALTVDAQLAAPDASQPSGKLHAAADVDATLQRPIDLELTAARFDFARYRPLVDALLGPDQLSALHGVLDGTLKARIEQRSRVTVQGKLTVAEPRIAGALVSGMDVRAPRWTLEPNVQLDLTPGAGVPRADLGGFHVDLGVLRVDGVPAATAAAAFAGAPALAFDYAVDLQALGKLGGPIPATIGAQPGQASGRVAFAVPSDGMPSDWLRFVTEALQLEASLNVTELALGTTKLGNVALSASARAGTVQASLAPGATVNGGAASFTARADLQKPARPTTFELGVRDAALAGDAAHVLQYALPLLAGLGEQANVPLSGNGTLTLSFTGPAEKAGAESWLDWLNRWSGTGNVALREASLQPAAAFASLIQFADPEGGGKLSLSDFATDLVLRQGAVETGLAKLDVKGRKIGLRGRTGLDGTLDHQLDLTDLLRGHRDGEKVLGLLRGAAIEATITGTLQAPRLAMPDLQALFAAALQNAAGQQVQKALDDLLKRIR